MLLHRWAAWAINYLASYLCRHVRMLTAVQGFAGAGRPPGIYLVTRQQFLLKCLATELRCLFAWLIGLALTTARLLAIRPEHRGGQQSTAVVSHLRVVIIGFGLAGGVG